ncbi:hypothetical protein KKC63_01500 [Patescibacteria group bacterium]|nr:hypothetical protein [Patescibacteria group bacterium]MBU4023058.1 hypothetical protein [Patescibacteria group bacterium]
MIKWCKKQIYIITKKNFISVFLWLFAIFFFILENFIDTDYSISSFLLALAIGQEIGYLVAKAKFKNK